LIRSLDANFSEEFKIGSIERKKISERFSDHKQLVNIVMGDAWQEDETLVKAINVFKNQSPCYQKTIKEILSVPSVINDKRRLDQLMPSYLHMFVNRLFVSNQRKTELIIYEYLLKYYDSKLAREKNERTVIETINAE
jgi:hypothetical protein